MDILFFACMLEMFFVYSQYPIILSKNTKVNRLISNKFELKSIIKGDNFSLNKKMIFSWNPSVSDISSSILVQDAEREPLTWHLIDASRHVTSSSNLSNS